MRTNNSIQYDTINYSQMHVLNLCDNCDNIIEDKNIKYKAVNKVTKENKQYCCKTCMQTDLTILHNW